MSSPAGAAQTAETLALAARLHSIYHTGEAAFTQGSPWYQVYVDYAVENGIIAANSYSDYNAAATRSQFAAILAKALPEEALEAVNTVEDGAIPDVPEGAANYDAIYQLYRAGILTGNDAAGTFTPNNTIVRSEVAALVTRMADPDLRRSVTLTAPVAGLDTLTAEDLQGVWRCEERNPISGENFVEYRELIFDGDKIIEVRYYENYEGIDPTVPESGFDWYCQGTLSLEKGPEYTRLGSQESETAQWGLYANDFWDWRGQGSADKKSGRVSYYVDELDLEEGYMIVPNTSLLTKEYRYERVSTSPVSDLRTRAEELMGPLEEETSGGETDYYPVVDNAMDYGVQALNYVYSHLKFPSTMEVVEIRHGVYNRTVFFDGAPDFVKPTNTYLSYNHDYYLVALDIKAANSLGALVTDTYVCLFDPATGTAYYDLEGYASDRADGAWGSTKTAYMDLESEAMLLSAAIRFRPFTQEEVQTIVSQVVR